MYTSNKEKNLFLTNRDKNDEKVSMLRSKYLIHIIYNDVWTYKSWTYV